jgi:cytochrome c oxidase subunit I
MSDGNITGGEGFPLAPKGFIHKYIWPSDHKVVAYQYFLTVALFMALGGFLAMLIRWQMAYPGSPVPLFGALFHNHFFFDSLGRISPTGYLQLATMHGTIMVFLVMIPLLTGGFGNFLIPLQIGARDMAFPFLNALSYWIYLAGGLVLFSSFFLVNGASEAGWTAYAPLSEVSTASPGSGSGQVFWLIGIFLTGFSSSLSGLNFLTTIVKMRAPGLSWGRLPMTTWAQLVTAFFQVLATPVLAAAVSLMFMDKVFGTSFFLPTGLHDSNDQLIGGGGGGHPLLWQHLFWFYSHPAVYILVLPAMGITSDLISTFARKPLFGYKAMVAAMAAIMALGFVVWGHHMFVSGMSPAMGAGFMMTTLMIAVPSGVKVFNWLGTLWRGNIHLTLPMLYALAFVSMFIVGGLSGIFMAATPVDVYIHDTYYVIAHFHYVVFGGSLFASFGAIHYWFPKMTGRLMNNKLGLAHWALSLAAFNCTFFPMHLLGEGGQMRRLATSTEYQYLQPLQHLNVFITLSAFVLGAAQFLFLVNLILSLKKGEKAPANPWNGNGLEWTIPSPAPFHNFDKIPTVYRGPYEYSSPEAQATGRDWIAQDEKPPVVPAGKGVNP